MSSSLTRSTFFLCLFFYLSCVYWLRVVHKLIMICRRRPLLLRFSQTKGMPVNQRPLNHCMRGPFDRMISSLFTKERRQSKTLETIDERGSKIARNCVFDCLWSPVGRQMAIENSVTNDFYNYVRCFRCRLSDVLFMDGIQTRTDSFCVITLTGAFKAAYSVTMNIFRKKIFSF